MADIGDALLSWIKLPGIISDEDAYSFRDIDDFNQIVGSFELLFNVTINGENDTMKLRQIRSIAKTPAQHEKFVQEIDFDKVLDCDHIELENFVQYLFYAKCEQNKEELKEQISRLPDEYSDELNKLLADNSGSSKNEQIIIATKVRGLAKILNENVDYQLQIDKLKNDLELLNNDSNAAKTSEESDYLQQIEKLRLSIDNFREEATQIMEKAQNQKLEISEKEKKKSIDFESKIENKQMEIQAALDKINAINEKLKLIPELDAKINKFEEAENAKKQEIKEKEEELEQIQAKIDHMKKIRLEEKERQLEKNQAKLDQKRFLEEEIAKQKAEILNKKNQLDNIQNDEDVLILSQKLAEFGQQLSDKKAETSHILTDINTKFNLE